MHLPEPGDARAWLAALDLTKLVHLGRSCQRQIPKPSIDRANKALFDLYKFATDLRLHACQREMAWIVFFMTPALLWPEPAKRATPLQANACPRHIG